MKPLTPLLVGRLASAVAAALMALAACAAPPDTSTGTAAQAPAAMATPMAATGKTYKVRIANFVFADRTLAVPVGSTVTWVNEDDIPHTVVSSDRKTFRSKVLDTDDSFTFTFTAAGEYPYFCSVHPQMTGKIVVTPN